MATNNMFMDTYYIVDSLLPSGSSMFIEQDDRPSPLLIILGCVQKCKVIANVLPWIRIPNDVRQQEQGSNAKHSRVTCTFERSSGDLNLIFKFSMRLIMLGCVQLTELSRLLSNKSKLSVQL